MKLNLTFVSSIGLISLIGLPHASAAVVPVRIRMIAAHFAYFNNPDPNGGKLISSSAGFDIAWNLRRFDDSLYTGGGVEPRYLKLACRGSMTYTPASGAPGCSSTFTFRPDANPVLYPEPVQNGEIVTLQIPGPTISGSGLAVDALVGDRTPWLPFICQVPNSGYVISGGSPSQTYSPKIPGVDPPFGYANVQFNIKSLPQVLPFTMTYENTRIDGAFSTVSKIVFFGRVEVTEDAPTVPLTPVDALTLGGYSPPTAGNPPADPPSDLTPPDAVDFSKWFKGIFPALTNSIQSALSKIHPAPTPFTLAAAASSSIITKVSPAAPFAGSVKIAVVLKPPGTTASPPFPEKFTENAIVPGTKNLKLTLDVATRNALKSGKAYSVFILTKATPKGGKSVVSTKRFSLKASGK